MNENLKSLSLDTLRAMYTREKEEMEKTLLRGARWQDVSSVQSMIRDIGMEIFKRLNGPGNPAEQANR